MQEQISLFINERQEKESTEFKTASEGRVPKDIWEPITAFANAEGGQIVFGVKPDGNFTGLKSTEIDMLQQAIQGDISSSYSFKLFPQFAITQQTLSVYIPPAPAAVRPVYSKKRGLPDGARVRVGASNVQVDEDWMKKFAIAAKGGAELLNFSLDINETLDDEIIDKYIENVIRVRGNVYSGIKRDEILKKLRVISQDKEITLFGLLAFSKGANLQDCVSPTVNIAVTQYRGSNKTGSSSSEGKDPFISNKEFFGPVSKLFEDSYNYLLGLLPLKGSIDNSGKRNDYFVVPDNALREVLANAIAHRDYSVLSSRIQVDIYSDRIEFINPGRSLVPIDELENTPSISRNPLLMGFLKDMGYTEQRARGIKTIKQAISNAGLATPKFENINTSFRVTLFSSAFFSDVDKDWVRKFEVYSLNQRQLTVLAHMHNNSGYGITNSEYREINSMVKVADNEKARRDIARLAELNILIPQGEYRHRRYYLNPSFL